MSAPTRSDAEIDALARRYRQGDTIALAGLHAATAYVIRPALARAITAGLPTVLDPQDLEQEAWVSLARLARKWDPALGAFGAYARASLTGALLNSVKSHDHMRRSRRVTVASIAHDHVWRIEISVEDGRAWADAMAFREHVAGLAARHRDVVQLVAVDDMTLTEAGQRLGISTAAAHRRFHSAALQIAELAPIA